ncbi:MAG TPA: biotin/lipoyl-containing protein [Actinomycetota bacterium]|nr:biotin/lipoyl-containing protein [Actinomycetota bacterium]
MFLVVTPAAGRIRLLPPRRFKHGREVVEAGQPVARLEQGEHHTLVRAAVGGTVASVLAIEGEPVRPGQPLYAIEPELP